MRVKFEPSDREALWNILWDNSISGLAMVAADGKFIRANQQFCTIVEYTEVELIGKGFAEITVPGDQSADSQLSMEVATGERESYDMVKRYLTKRNKVVWVHLRVIPYKLGDEFIYFLSQISEIKATQSTESDLLAQMQNPKTSISFEGWMPMVATIVVPVVLILGAIVAMGSG